MYKKMLLAGVAGTLALSAIAAPAMATPKVSHKQAVRAHSGDYKFCVKNHNLKSHLKIENLTCKQRFGKGYKEISPERLGIAGTAGMNATSSPQLSDGTALVNQATHVPVAFTFQILIDNYDPALKYTTKASIGTLGTVNACTTNPTNNYYEVGNVGKGCIWLQGPGFMNQSSIVEVWAQGSGLAVSTGQQIEIWFPNVP